MEQLVIAVIVIGIIGLALATPIAAFVALSRTSELQEELTLLRQRLAEVGRRLKQLNDRLPDDAPLAGPADAPDAARTAPSPPLREAHPGVFAPVASRVATEPGEAAGGAPPPEPVGEADSATGEAAAEWASTEAAAAEAAAEPAAHVAGQEAADATTTEEPAPADGLGAPVGAAAEPAEEPAPAQAPRAPVGAGVGAGPRATAGHGPRATADSGEGAAGPTPESIDFETVIGTTWVLRIGLGVLAIALALFARTMAPQLPPAAKVAVAYLGAWALFGVGKFYEDRLDRFARPVMAAGLVFGFFVAFSAYFVPAMASVSLPVSIAWMAVSMGIVLVAAERWSSQPIAALAVLLGHISGFVATATGEADVYALSIIAFLALTSAVLVLRHRWFELGVFAVLLSYGAHLLWLLSQRGPVEGDRGFWVNLTFLTSYYVVFLIADVLWWRRHGESESTEDEGGPVSPRYLGPANLVLYVSLTSFVYVATGAHLESIEWFYIALGTAQGVLAWLYRSAHHRDYVFYPAYGTILWTLGMFAALDALSLNLVLAGQALLLLVAAHRTRLWVFHMLAQAALLVAFVHYWTFPAPEVSTWPLLLGGMGLVAVYLLKASLEEMWYGPDRAPDWVGSEAEEAQGAAGPSGGLAERAFHALFAPIAPLLAYFHAVLGGLVLVREARAHFGWTPGLSLFVGLSGVLIVAIVLLRRRTALLFAMTSAALASVLLVPLNAGAGRAPVPQGAGSASFLLLLGLAATALSLGAGASRRLEGPRVTEATEHGLGVVFLFLVGSVLAMAGLDPSFPRDAVWLVIPVAALVFQELVAATTREEGVGGARAFSHVLTGGAALAMIAIIADGVGMEPLAVVWVAAGTVVLLSIAALRSGGAFGVGGYTLMLAGYFYFLLYDRTLAITLLSTLWMGAVATLVPLGVALVLDAREEGPEGETLLDRSDAATLVAYALGLALLGGLAYAQLPVGWAQLAPAVVGLALVAGSRRFGLARAVPAVVVALALLHAFVLTGVTRAEGVADALWPLVGLGVVTLVTERLMGDLADRKPGPGFADGTRPVLVAAATLSVMAAVYTSALFGEAWATAGWSLLAGLLMGAGFFLRASLYRRTALLVLTVCLVRVFLVDTRGLSSTAKIGVFFVLGSCLVGVALLYSKYSDRMKDWL